MPPSGLDRLRSFDRETKRVTEDLAEVLDAISADLLKATDVRMKRSKCLGDGMAAGLAIGVERPEVPREEPDRLPIGRRTCLPDTGAHNEPTTWRICAPGRAGVGNSRSSNPAARNVWSRKVISVSLKRGRMGRQA